MFRAIMQRFGRSYNNRYDFLPNDAQEKDRNTLQHNIAVEVLDGRLYLAPVTNPRRVLDLGCGPGDWTIDVAKRNPTAAVFGIDVEPVKPRVRLPNCRFHLGDFTEKWPYDGKFDLIHLRHLGSLPSKDVIATMYDRLEPGGWVEFCEWIVAIQSPRNSLADSWFYKWAQHWEAGLNAIGTSAFYPEGYKQLLLEAGFQNVTIRKYGVPINPWPPGKQLQKVGSMMVQNTDLSIEPMSHAILGGVLGWSTDAIDGILSEVRKELNDTRVRNFMTLFCVYAQKPRDFSSSSTSLVSAKSR
ncbi:S-adenosyl-L-methionine-dependent methyltransferase [Xylariaceae sp. FL1019]|nr:S-adenosyl-L-methionine-dependent methyltransferase [Xylariaceae sp. FL1019]